MFKSKSLSWRRGCSHGWDSPVAVHLVFDVPVPLQLPFVAHSTVAVLGHVGMPVVVNDRSWRCRRCSFAVMDVAGNLQRHVVSRHSRCIRLSSSPEFVDISLRTETVTHSAAVHGGGGVEGYFAAVLQHFSASVHLDVEAQGSGGGGDAGSLTPRCSATPIRCIRDGNLARHISLTHRQNYNHHNHHNYNNHHNHQNHHTP